MKLINSKIWRSIKLFICLIYIDFNLIVNIGRSHIWRDRYFCKLIPEKFCTSIPYGFQVKNSCPQKCGQLSCNDTVMDTDPINCVGITTRACTILPYLKHLCPRSCEICTKPFGKLKLKVLSCSISQYFSTSTITQISNIHRNIAIKEI